MSTFAPARNSAISIFALVCAVVAPVCSVGFLLKHQRTVAISSAPPRYTALPIYTAAQDRAWDYVMLPNNMGLRWYDQGRYQQAIPYFEKCVKRCSEVQLGQNGDIFMGGVYNNLGKAYVRVGRVKEAVPMFEKALKLRTAAFGISSEITYGTVKELIPAYIMLGRVQEASDLKKAVGTVKPIVPLNP